MKFILYKHMIIYIKKQKYNISKIKSKVRGFYRKLKASKILKFNII